jgi:hypothetical protein
MTTVTFTSSGTWTNPGAVTVDCRAWGEGGNGGNAVNGQYSGAGGGGGAYAEETALAVHSTTYTFTIGGGGTGTNTSFPGDSVTVTANAGGSASGHTAGSGGTAGSNSIAHNGGNGAAGIAGKDHPGQGGGGSAGAGGAGGNASGASGGSAGSGSPGGAAGANGSTGDGANGSAPGGGGAGSGNYTGFAGGSGAAGQITLIYTAATAGTATLTGVGTLTATSTLFIPGQNVNLPVIAPGYTWLRHFAAYKRNLPPPYQPPQTVAAHASLTGLGTLNATGTSPQPVVVNQWSNSYGQGTTFTSITSALQSCVVPLVPSYSVGPGSGVPTAGNWLFAISSWTQDPTIASVHVGVGDDIHEWWREFPAAGPTGITRTSIAYSPNIGTFGSAVTPGNVYVAPDMEVAAINVLVIEVQGLGPWDTVTGTDAVYDAASTSISLSLSAPPQASFFIGAVGGDNVNSGQAFAPSGWTALETQTQTNGSNDLADNILTAACFTGSSSVSVTGSATTAENLSGFLIAVENEAASPVPATQNPNWPYTIVEAGFGSGFNTPDSEVTWTNLSTRPWNWEETTGIQFELNSIQATNAHIEFDNYDGALSPLNSSSPYYPDVLPGTPIRMRMALGTIGGNTVNKWYVLQRNAAQWDEKIAPAFRKYCEVAATDLWAALSATPPTFYRSEVYEDAPYAWWPMDDQPGTSGILPTYLLNAAFGNSNVLNIVLSPNGGAIQPYYDTTGRNTSTPESDSTGSSAWPPGIAVYTVGTASGWMFGDPQSSPASVEAATGSPASSIPGSAAWQASGQAGSTGSYGWFLSCNDSSFPPLSSGITVEIWFNAIYYASATGWGEFDISDPGGGVESITEQPYNAPITLWEIATGSHPVAVLQLTSNGSLQLITYNGSTGTTHSIYTESDLRSNSWHMATVTLTQTTWTVWLDGGVNAQVSGTATGMTSAWTWLIANGDLGSNGGNSAGTGLVHGGNISLSHLAVYPTVLPYYRILDHYWAAISAFGQIPAPTGIQVTWTEGQVGPLTGSDPNLPIENYFTADGSLGGLSGGYDSFSGTGISVIVTANVTGSTSGPSAWAASTTSYHAIYAGVEPIDNVFPFIAWNGVAPLFNVYTSETLGSEKEAAVVAGNGDSFNSGYGGSASGQGVAQTTGGNGSSPPTAPSAIGDTVGERIERLMRGGRCSSPNRCIDPAPLLVQAPGTQGGSIQVGASIQAIQQSDSGMLFVDNLNHLTYWQRPHLASQYSSPVWNIGPSSGKYAYYREIEWVTDPQRIWNAITVEPLSPTGASLPDLTPQNASGVLASQIQYGAQPLQITSWLQSLTEMQNQADWLFTFYGIPQRRAQNIRIDAASNPAFWPLVIGANVGDIVTLEDWAIGGGGNVYTMRITEIRRHFEYAVSGENAEGSEVVASAWLTLDYEPTSYWS